MANKELYHGWLIEVVLEQEGYAFQCWLPGEMMAVGDRQIYATIEGAKLAAKVRADLESLRWSLNRFLAEMNQQSKLNFSEQHALSNSITAFVKALSRQVM